MTCRLFLPALLALCLPCLGAAATADELLGEVDKSLKPDELEEPGNAVRAKAIAALLGEDLGLAKRDVLDLRLALAGAWLDAGKLGEARGELDTVLHAGEVTPEQRERAGLTWIATWQVEWKTAEKPGDLPSALDALKPLGSFGPKVQARAHSAEGQRRLALKQNDGVLAHYDEALVLLKDLPPAERVPVYALRLLAMEELGQKPEDVQAWLQGRSADPAAAQVLDSALTAGEKLIGQPAPPLKGRRVDGKVGDLDLSAWRGKPVLVDFFATWAKPSAGVAPGIAAAAAHLAAKGLVTIGVSLDTKDTLPNLPAYITKHGIGYPVIGDGLGWDSEVDDAWHVDGLPALILVAPDGTIAANDLVGGSSEDTARNIENAVDAVLGGKPVVEPDAARAPAPPTPAPAAKPPAPRAPAADPGFVP